METAGPVAPSGPGTERLLRESGLFEGCTAGELADLLRVCEVQSFDPGQDIVREGDEGRYVYVIKEGDAAVLKAGSSAAGHHEMARMGAGDHFGEFAVFDPGPRSATVRALTPVTVLAIPISSIVAEGRPQLAGVLNKMTRHVISRFRASSVARVAALDRALEEERTRADMGRFVVSFIIAYSLYTFALGAAGQLKAALGHTELVSAPILALTAAIQLHTMRRLPYGAGFYGLTLKNGWRHALEALLFTVPLMALTVAIKLALLAWVPSMHGLPVFQLFGGGPAARFNPALALAYVVFVPIQELTARGGLQSALEHFLVGRGRTWKAIVGANIIFSAMHLHISLALAVTAFITGLFWGWLFSRQRSLVGVILSHLLLGFWAFEVVDLGVLE